MLKHEENSETFARPAAQVRVTPDELALALSRIEARKDAGQRNVDGTISIGEAVQQLGVDTTPEEVLAEVQAIRQEPMRTKKRWLSAGQRLALLSGIGLGIIGLVGWWSVPHATQGHALPAAVASSPTPQETPRAIPLDRNLVVQDASGKLVMLSEVTDGHPIRCFFSDWIPVGFLPFTPDQNPAGAWTLIKYDGKVYVRGWTPRISTKALTTVGTDVSGDVSYIRSECPVAVTLAVDGFRVPAGTGNGNVFHAVNIQLDKHAYEKWKP